MRVEKDKIIEVGSSPQYWQRVYFISDDDKLRSSLIIYAFLEYYYDIAGVDYKDRSELEKWFDGVIKNWVEKGDVIFKKRVQSPDVYAIDESQRQEGYKYIIENIRPDKYTARWD